MKDQRNTYIDGYVFPILKVHLDTYKEVAEQVAEIWKEHGALSYIEYVADNLKMEGTRSFTEVMDAKEDETIIFGYVMFESQEAHKIIHKKVAEDPRIADIVAPLVDPAQKIFDAQKMAYGVFKPFINSSRID